MKFNRVAALAGVTSVTLLVSLTGWTPPAGAYVKESCHLSSPYQIHYLNSASGSYYSIGQTAVADWTATPTKLSFVGGSIGAFQMKNINYGATGYDGITNFGACSGGVFTTYSLATWNSHYTDGYSTTGKRQVMVHEIGPALGLAHAGSSSCSGQPIVFYSSDRYFISGH